MFPNYDKISFEFSNPKRARQKNTITEHSNNRSKQWNFSTITCTDFEIMFKAITHSLTNYNHKTQRIAHYITTKHQHSLGNAPHKTFPGSSRKSFIHKHKTSHKEHARQRNPPYKPPTLDNPLGKPDTKQTPYSLPANPPAATRTTHRPKG